MADAWDRVDSDPEIRCAILTGAGGVFCAGADLKAMISAQGESDARDGSARTPAWPGRRCCATTG